MDKTKPLNRQEKLFKAEYLLCKNVEEAAIRAGYASSTARKIAPMWIGKNRESKYYKAHLAAAIDADINGIATELKVSEKRVLAELAKIAFSNIQDYLEKGNTVRDIASIPRPIAAAVKTIKITRDVLGGSDEGDGVVTRERIEFQLHDKLKALEDLGRNLNLFRDDNTKTTIVESLIELRTYFMGSVKGLPSEQRSRG